jgi:outer membrane lipoprotein-sorting protein
LSRQKCRVRRVRIKVGLIVAIVAAIGSPAASAAEHSLEDTLAKMDQAAAHFKGLSANVLYGSHMEAIHEDDAETGTMLVKRPKPKDMHVKISIEKPDVKVAVTDGNEVKVYYPNSGEIDKISLKDKRSLVGMIMALGFGGTSKELKTNYEVQLSGAETVSGESTTRLELIPKSPELLEQWKRIDLWISDKSGYAVQQKFYDRGKDYTVITYSNVKMNPEIPDSAFNLDAPKGTPVQPLNSKKK